MRCSGPRVVCSFQDLAQKNREGLEVLTEAGIRMGRRRRESPTRLSGDGRAELAARGGVNAGCFRAPGSLERTRNDPEEVLQGQVGLKFAGSGQLCLSWTHRRRCLRGEIRRVQGPRSRKEAPRSLLASRRSGCEVWAWFWWSGAVRPRRCRGEAARRGDSVRRLGLGGALVDGRGQGGLGSV